MFFKLCLTSWEQAGVYLNLINDENDYVYEI